MSILQLSLARLRWLCAACVALTVCTTAHGVVNGTLIPCNDRRFDAVGLFITMGTNGLICPGAVSGSCVLVGPDVVMIARHSIDGGQGAPLPNPATYRFKVRFRRAVNGDAVNTHVLNGSFCHEVYQEFFITRFADITPNNGTDIILGYLERAPVGIRPIQPELNNPPRAATNVILAGWGYSGPCFASGDHWALRYARGRSPDNLAVNDYFVFSPCSLGSSAPCASCPANLTAPYVLANLHDSGAGVFIEVPSTDINFPIPELRLVGTVSTPNLARRPSAWNNANGQPRITQPAVRPSASSFIGDFNRDGVINFDDVDDYLAKFFAGACIADVNADGNVGIDDVLIFISAFFKAP